MFRLLVYSIFQRAKLLKKLKRRRRPGSAFIRVTCAGLAAAPEVRRFETPNSDCAHRSCLDAARPAFKEAFDKLAKIIGTSDCKFSNKLLADFSRALVKSIQEDIKPMTFFEYALENCGGLKQVIDWHIQEHINNVYRALRVWRRQRSHWEKDSFPPLMPTERYCPNQTIDSCGAQFGR